MRPVKRLSLAAVYALPCAAALAAEPAPLDAGARSAAVQDAAKALSQRYIHPDVGARAARTIRDALAAGHYDSISDASAFAARLTADLRAETGDKHLRVDVRAEKSPDTPAPPVPLSPRSEAGVVRTDRLPGNIGYIEISGFPPLEAFRPVIGKAMATMAGTRALIIDVRRNGGGSPLSEVYLASYFLDPKESVVVSRIIWRTPGTRDFRTVDYRNSVTPFRYAGKPIHVLTSERTFSGGEALAYDMQALKLGKVVGEVTGGGANPGGIVLLRSQLSMFVPSGRNENRVTGTSWEGTGVKPDIATVESNALQAALDDLGIPTDKTTVEALSEQRLFEPDSEASFRQLLAVLVDRDSPKRYSSHVRQQQSRARQMLRAMGALQSLTFVGVDPHGYDVFDVRFDKGPLTFLVCLDSEGRAVIADVQPTPGG